MLDVDRDLESIGAHCQYTYCNQLDFLPFRCESCRGTYCLDHRTEDGHDCPHRGAWAAARRAASSTTPTSNSLLPNGKPTLATGTQCSEPACKTYIHTHTSVGVGCSTCGRSYCLKHRLPEDHKCSTLRPIKSTTSSTSAGSTNPAQRAATALARLRAWGKSKAEATKNAAASGKNKSSTASETPAKSASRSAPKTQTTAPSLAELKRTAKGDSRVPTPKRIYLHIEAVAADVQSTSTSTGNASAASKPQMSSQHPPHGAMFFSGDWSVGRLLDEAARGLQVENVNNRGGGEEQRLRVFHVEAGRLLEFGEKVGECGLRNGNTVVLLRGVGPIEAAP